MPLGPNFDILRALRTVNKAHENVKSETPKVEWNKEERQAVEWKTFSIEQN